MNIDRRNQALQDVDEKRYRVLLESFAQAVWEADAHGHVLDGSSWSRYTGQGPDASLGLGWLHAVHPDDRQRVQMSWEMAVRGGAVYHVEYRVQHAPQNQWVWTLAHATPLLDERGTPFKWVGMNVDISVRKGAEAALHEAARQKDEFVAILAHELRNPLAPLRSGIDLLLTETATPAAKERTVAMMGRQISHMSRLVEDLIDASRITTGQLQVYREETSLRQALAAATEHMDVVVKAKRQEVVVTGLDTMDAVLHGDAVRLTQAFSNVLSNSSKFSPERSTIRIEVSPQEQQVTVVIRDRGQRIPDADLSNVFKLFVLSARHDRGDGLGIGLALVEDVVKSHGGTVHARNAAEGEGVEFIIVLPVLSFTRGSTYIKSALPEASVQFRPLRVLIADDNYEAAEILGTLLEMAGHTIRIAHDGVEALQEASAFLPDAIFMDVGMPRMDGLESARRIRQANPTVRPYIIALTGWSSEFDRAESHGAGCDLHIAKPANFDAVAEAISRATAFANAAQAIAGNANPSPGPAPVLGQDN